MSATKAMFVLIHGGWHNHSSWDRVTPILKSDGPEALTIDLPGAGANAIASTSLGLRRFDPAAFAAEPSPNGAVTQEERTRAVVALVKEAASLSDGRVILVGHSAGGMTASAVAHQVPNLLLAKARLRRHRGYWGRRMLVLRSRRQFSAGFDRCYDYIPMMMKMRPTASAIFRSFQALIVALVLAALAPTPAAAAIDPAQAESIFQQANTICTRDGGAVLGTYPLWSHAAGRSRRPLCCRQPG
ncbi:alpha/beta fold hydrolase [Tunturiibacter psychrotolerans]|uniref:alpha/beta fold hydrolase n=1 Tax=Tunturiibacter psychrotolerans TaxID=3069686 RepID=UPI003D1D95BD